MKMMMDAAEIVCPQCGYHNDTGAQKCVKCSLDLAWAVENWDQQVTGPQESYPPLILYVDDEVGALTLVGIMLERAGYRVAKARDAFEALDLTGRLVPDLIITGVMMPRMDGLEMITRLKADSALCDIPVMILSARGDAESVKRGFEVGAVEYLSKPILHHDLEGVVARVLGIELPPLVLFLGAEGIRHLDKNLREKGYRSWTYLSDDVPITWVERVNPDLIAVAFHLAEAEGLVVLKALKADPAARNIPVVMLADKPEPELEQRALKLGAVAVHTGPPDADALAAVFRAALGEK